MFQQQLPFDAPQHKNIIEIPLHKSLVEVCCQEIVTRHRESLPDLTAITVLLNDSKTAPGFRQCLLEKAAAQGCSALLGPRIIDFDSWMSEFSIPDLRVINNHTRELLMIDALKDFPHLHGHGNPWVLTASLMELFDELTRWHIELPVDLQQFVSNLGSAYGLQDITHEYLGREASLVHTLWHAMRQQLSELGCIDMETARVLRLAQSLESLNEKEVLYFCGLILPTPAQQTWQNTLLDRNQLFVVTHNYNETQFESTRHPYHQCLSMIYDIQNTPLVERARQCQSKFVISPVENVISFFSANSAEQEAAAIDLQVRRWLLEGKKNIGVVTENRKLARRVRALLERADVLVDDDAGWPLSTTSAATLIERWLETVESDFHYLSLLDCLKSPFIPDDNNEMLELIYLFEQHIIYNENVTSNIHRYCKNIEYRKHRSPQEFAGNYRKLTDLLKHVEQAALPLDKLKTRLHPAEQFLDGLLSCLKQLNIYDSFSVDAAGAQILSEIEQMRIAVSINPMDINWLTFRNWLGLTLERFNFKLSTRHSPVTLLTLSGCHTKCFDGLIIASAEQDYLPKQYQGSPFFNNAVRTSLGIRETELERSIDYYNFLRLLAAVVDDKTKLGDILITRRTSDNGEDIIGSPWCDLMQSFHQHTFNTPLENRELAEQLETGQTQIQRDHHSLPSPGTPRPAPAIHAELVPNTWSASAYQQLINCPYQFYAARCLKLAPPEMIREQLMKSDYGERIHLCLQAFHSNVSNLPGPFTNNLSADNREQAIQLLNDISSEVFATDIEDNFMHRGWLKHWQDCIPRYIDWQIQHQTHWRIDDCEINISGAVLNENIKIGGRIDRVDRHIHESSINILDYKTGSIPRQDDIENGEAVQLPFYGILIDLITSMQRAGSPTADNYTNSKVEYVNLDDPKKVRSTVSLQDELLMELKDKNRQRLIDLTRALSTGANTPAWGDPDTCRYCDMEGLCRKSAWQPASTD